MKKILLGFIMALAVMMSVFSQTEADFNVELTADHQGVVIKKYTGSVTQVRIPVTIQGMPVREIGDEAFLGIRTAITSVVIPNGVTKIGRNAFGSQDNRDNIAQSRLVSIIIPDTVTAIGDSAFSNCVALTTVNIPNSVTFIGALAFSNCTRLETITIPNSVTSIGIGAFSGSGLRTITWPASVTKIQGGRVIYGWYEDFFGMFQNCRNLQTVIISNGVTEIGDGAFMGCTSLSSITIPNSVTSIGISVFYNCSRLESISIPNSVTSIGGSAFARSGLRTITWPASVTRIILGNYGYFHSNYTYEQGMFYNCINLQTVIISEGVTEIGAAAFYGCSALTSITLPSTIEVIGWFAFRNCSALTTVTIPDSVENISFSPGFNRDQDSFNGCSRLTLTSQAALRRRGYTGEF